MDDCLYGNNRLSVLLTAAVVILVASAYVSTFTIIHAEESQPLLYLYIPEKMMAGQTYHGAVITDNPAPLQGGIVHLASGSHNIDIPKTTVIPAGKNHAIFPINTVREGIVEVHATYGGLVGAGGGTIYAVSTEPRGLDLIMPGNKTSAPDLAGVVVLLDGNGHPTQAITDTPVSLVPSGLVQTRNNTITIDADRTHASFQVGVAGSGTITAAAAGLAPDTEELVYDRDNVRVRFLAAPDVVLPGGMLRYAVWLERSTGAEGYKPFHPPHAISAELQTSDTKVVRLTEVHPSYGSHNTKMITMQNGVAVGTLYAGASGYALLTAAVPEYGTATIPVCVGSIVSSDAVDGGCTRDDSHVQHGQTAHNITRDPPTGNPDPSTSANHIRLWLLPDVNSGHAEAVVGFYRLDGEDVHTFEFDDDYYDDYDNDENSAISASSEARYESLTPVRTDHHHITVAGSGISVQPHHTTIPTRYTNMYSFPVYAPFEGVYNVSVTSLGSTSTSHMLVEAPHDTTYRLQVVPVPSVATIQQQPLFLFAITDSSGHIVDIQDEFGHDRTVQALLGSTETKVVVDMETNTGVMYGHTNGSKDVMLAILDGTPGAATISSTITPMGVPVSVEMDVPPVVHAGEQFPVAVHVVDSAGVPVYRAGPDVEAVGFDLAGGFGVAGQAGNIVIGVLDAAGGAVQGMTNSFLNVMNVTADAPGVVPAGRPFQIGTTITGMTGNVTYDIVSPWPAHAISSGTFEVMPDTEGNVTITIRAAKEGFAPGITTVPVRSEMAVPITVQAGVAGQDTSLEVDITWQQNDTVTTITKTPFSTILRHPANVTITFPEEIGAGSGYGLLDVSYGGGGLLSGSTIMIRPGDGVIAVDATYEKRIQIFVTNGRGSGIYPYGTPVLISAEPGVVVPYLIPERLAYWDGGAPEQSEMFVMIAKRNIELEAVFEPDYARVFYLAIAGAMASAFFTYVRYGTHFKYRLDDALEGLRRS